ncbi:MAG: class I SAM-dependent methyltransferase [Casimicrobiaceae bacterium]
MSDDFEFTGERFVPGIAGEIAHEHWHRYAFARRFVAGKRVLDVACGEGYGSALIAAVAEHVVGVDIDSNAIAHARAKYASNGNLRFEHGSATVLPLPERSVDVVISFETIEHLAKEDQPRMLAECARVLKVSGVLVLSAPNRLEYSEARGYRNPFHLHEHDRGELEQLLVRNFSARRWYRQRRYFGSAIWNETGGELLEAWNGGAASATPAEPPEAMYFVVVAARAAEDLPPPGPAVSLFSDHDGAELSRLDAQAQDVLRLDSLLKERDRALDTQAAHIEHLEELVAFRERIVVERDGQLAAITAERETITRERERVQRMHVATEYALAAQRTEFERLERALTAQERIIAYRQTLRWWLALPWLRLKLWWQRVRGT